MKGPKKYFNNCVAAILFILEKPPRSYSPATFHKLRVEIKKLKACFELIDFCTKGFKRKSLFKPFKQIFQQAGKIRELQVEEMILKSYFSSNQLKNYKKHLHNLRLKERQLFFSIVNNSLITNLKNSHDKILPFISKIDENRIDKFMKKNRTKIKSLLAQNKFRTTQIHELRKRLKEYYYIQKMLHLDTQNTHSNNKNLLTELLGKWHDYQIILRHLKNVNLASEINAEEISQLNKIKVEIKIASKLLLRKIKSATHIPGF